MRIAGVLLVGAILMAACGGPAPEALAPSSSEVPDDADVANPASVFCEDQGGKAFGPEPMCGLPDGSVVDAWEYFRSETEVSSTSPSATAPASTAPPSTAPTTTVTPTTIPLDDPGASLDALAGLLGAVDHSRVSEGPCGTFGLIVKTDRITFYEWDGSNWNDQSERLGADGSSEPFRVTSRDYTGDGVIEFLVEYEALDATGTYQFGSVFYPTYGEGLYGDGSWGCDWGWSFFRSDEDDYFADPPYAQTLRHLRWEDGALRATVQQYRGGTEAVVSFDSLNNIFEVRWP